jgi:hypothetical protein
MYWTLENINLIYNSPYVPKDKMRMTLHSL